MAKLVLICGKLCCGKTTYAKRLAKEIYLFFIYKNFVLPYILYIKIKNFSSIYI